MTEEKNELMQEERGEAPDIPEAEKSAGAASAATIPDEATAAKDAAFSEIKPEVTSAERQRNLDFLLDIPLELTVELGRTKMLIQDLLRLNEGSVVELGKAASEPLDIFVNQKLVARGEVVVVNDKFGIRLASIISPAERVKRLG